MNRNYKLFCLDMMHVLLKLISLFFFSSYNIINNTFFNGVNACVCMLNGLETNKRI